MILAQTENFINSQTVEMITNPYRTDGFGAQFQTIIYSVIYAEMNHRKFRYTPFVCMEHNYGNDRDFIKKKEQLINFIGNFELNEDTYTPQNQSIIDYINYFEQNLTECANSESLKKIKRIFRENKDKADYFDSRRFNIAIHIRRPNPHDSRIDGTDIPDSFYLRCINILREAYSSKCPLFHIYSQGNIEDFKNIYNSPDVIFHINDEIEYTFTSLVMADVLLISRSSFSYTAGILSEGTVYYIPFWHPALPNWITLFD